MMLPYVVVGPILVMVTLALNAYLCFALSTFDPDSPDNYYRGPINEFERVLNDVAYTIQMVVGVWLCIVSGMNVK